MHLHVHNHNLWFSERKKPTIFKGKTYMKLLVSVTLMTDEDLPPLLDNLWTIYWFDRHGCSLKKIKVASYSTKY
jgi:hypothetical protein